MVNVSLIKRERAGGLLLGNASLGNGAPAGVPDSGGAMQDLRFGGTVLPI